MCEANAYIRQDGVEELLLEQVDKIIPQGNELYLENIFGQQKKVKAKIVEMALVDHKIILERVLYVQNSTRGAMMHLDFSLVLRTHSASIMSRYGRNAPKDSGL